MRTSRPGMPGPVSGISIISGHWSETAYQTSQKCIAPERRGGDPFPISHECRTRNTNPANKREIIMTGNRTFITLSLATALGVLGAASAVAAEHGRGDRGGFVVPGSLAGVNPVYHPDIFGNPAVAREYGFVQSRDGVWHVRADWRGETIDRPGARAFGYAIGTPRARAEYR
jgi:hypothetical protein